MLKHMAKQHPELAGVIKNGAYKRVITTHLSGSGKQFLAWARPAGAVAAVAAAAITQQQARHTRKSRLPGVGSGPAPATPADPQDRG
jgi:hypothetical protein